MIRRPGAATAFEERLESFLAMQQRIVADFERSLANARRFIELARVAISREPDETAAMLEQVREIDLLRHVGEQFENFQSIAAMLADAQGPPGSGPQGGMIANLRKRYEALLQEAEAQAERIATTIGGMTPVN